MAFIISPETMISKKQESKLWSLGSKRNRLSIKKCLMVFVVAGLIKIKPVNAQCNEQLTGTNGSGYKGCQTKTRSGKTCESWDMEERRPKDKPPRYSTVYKKVMYDTTMDYTFGFKHNYCRNPWPLRYDGILCHIRLNGKTSWEYCDPMDSNAVVELKVNGKMCPERDPQYISKTTQETLETCSLKCTQTAQCQEISFSTNNYCRLHKENCKYSTSSSYKVYCVAEKDICDANLKQAAADAAGDGAQKQVNKIVIAQQDQQQAQTEAATNKTEAKLQTKHAGVDAVYKNTLTRLYEQPFCLPNKKDKYVGGFQYTLQECIQKCYDDDECSYLEYKVTKACILKEDVCVEARANINTSRRQRSIVYKRTHEEEFKETVKENTELIAGVAGAAIAVLTVIGLVWKCCKGGPSQLAAE